MKIQLTSDRATATMQWRAGEVIEMDEAEARRLINAGQAIPADEPPVRHATKEPPRRMVKR